jgi:hypothetical protein
MPVLNYIPDDGPLLPHDPLRLLPYWQTTVSQLSWQHQPRCIQRRTNPAWTFPNAAELQALVFTNEAVPARFRLCGMMTDVEICRHHINQKRAYTNSMFCLALSNPSHTIYGMHWLAQLGALVQLVNDRRSSTPVSNFWADTSSLNVMFDDVRASSVLL